VDAEWIPGPKPWQPNKPAAELDLDRAGHDEIKVAAIVAGEKRGAKVIELSA
jgi:hypothetical protein